MPFYWRNNLEKCFYTTTTGIKIGSCYTPPPPIPNRDEERIQAVMLGIEHDWSPRRTTWYFAYGCFILLFVSALMIWVRP
jgi:hypothetical protein